VLPVANDADREGPLTRAGVDHAGPVAAL
jgi:hypothetical protein